MLASSAAARMALTRETAGLAQGPESANPCAWQPSCFPWKPLVSALQEGKNPSELINGTGTHGHTTNSHDGPGLQVQIAMMDVLDALPCCPSQS